MINLLLRNVTVLSPRSNTENIISHESINRFEMYEMLTRDKQYITFILDKAGTISLTVTLC